MGDEEPDAGVHHWLSSDSTIFGGLETHPDTQGNCI
jgi:hypothetical protein